MRRLRVMTVYGTRPEAIKVAPVLRALEEDPRFESIAIVTGQHKEMLDQVNSLFGIKPVQNLEIMSRGQNLNMILSRIVSGMDEVYEQHQPDLVLVQGDTSTAMGSALAAFNRGIPVAHIEAGLRSGDLLSPFPEEANRKLISQVASVHLAPTERTRANLMVENVPTEQIVVTGNTVLDALMDAVEVDAPFEDPTLKALVEGGQRIVLVTTHRRENLGAGMLQIGQAIAELAKLYPEVHFVVPLHLNPEVRQILNPYLEGQNIVVTEPIAYGDFTRLLAATFLVLTDSGGIQEEAPGLDIPVLVMRENTERQEGVEAGTLRLVGTETEEIVQQTRLLLDDCETYERMAAAINPYGDGYASERILEALWQRFGSEN